MEYFNTLDSPEAVERCLRCKKPECTNCLEQSGQGRFIRGPKQSMERVMNAIGLVKAGYSRESVAIMYDVNRRTIDRWVARYGGEEQDDSN